jgi:uncharacterized membrane protein
MIGLVSGSATVWSGGWSFATPWILISYALFVLMILLNVRLSKPWVERVLTLARASSSAEPSPELRRVLSDTRGKVHMFVAPVVISMQVVLMIVKPFS